MKVLNKRKDKIPEGAVYVGRPSKWGNPFTIGKDGNREQVITAFMAYASLKLQLYTKQIEDNQIWGEVIGNIYENPELLENK